MTATRKQIALGICLLVLVVALQLLRKANIQSPPPPTFARLTEKDREVIARALRNAELPQPLSLDIDNSGNLVAVYTPDAPPSNADARSFATTAVSVIREAMVRRNVVSNYRVTLNGPSIGQGLIIRYGSALFSEGGSVDWQAR
jgi:hypothetical protein